ncbi:MAG: FMN-binding protein [Treponema sp.]|jgi:fumarate reductase flavoprotein subunit|nr:FMN-binding protein [Treponema sp.]
MKTFYLVFCLCAAALLFPRCAGMEQKSKQQAESLSEKLVDGVYEGSARGYRGLIGVSLRVEGGGMAEIDIVDSAEDPFVGGAAIEELLELALIYNTADLDAISGATESSEGFLAALSNALEQARR